MKIGNKTFRKRALGLTIAAVIIAIMFIPTLYSFTYLKAFWDPYGNLDKIPVAFVNLDRQVTKDDKTYSIGKDLEDKLKDNKKVKWEFTTYEDAKKGVQGTEYYAMIVVPEDFSKKIADSTDGKFDKPELIYESNKGKNFIFSQISDKVETNIKNEIASDLAKETSKTLTDNLYKVKDSISDAKDGSTKLVDGTTTLVTKMTEMKSGTGKLTNASVEIIDKSSPLIGATAKLSDVTSQLYNGTNNIVNGQKQLTDFLGSASEGTNKIQGGLKQLKSGQDGFISKFDSLIKGTQQLNTQLTRKNPKVDELVKGADSVRNGVSDLRTNATQSFTQSSTQLAAASKGVSQTADGVESADKLLNSVSKDVQSGKLSPQDIAYIQKATEILNQIQKSDLKNNIAEPLQKASVSSDPKNNELIAALAKLQVGTEGVADGVGTLVQGADTGTSSIIKAEQGFKDGAVLISDNLGTLSDKTGELSAGISGIKKGSAVLYDGSVALNNGVAAVNNAMPQVHNGVSATISGVSQLHDGLVKADDGAAALKDGAVQIDDGLTKLDNGLGDGYDELNGKLKFKSDDLGNFVSDPVNTNDKSINDVKFYGEGLAPYFVSLSLWLGALFISIVITIARFAKVVKNKFLRTFTGKALVGSAYASIQAVILSFALVKGLNIDLTNTTNFYLNNIFISVVFFLVMYGVSYALGALGSPVLFVAMILQLSSCAGTFPIETAPQFYVTINKYLPMTYSVKLLRFIISGMDNALYWDNIRIMLMFAVGCAGCGFVIRTTINFIKKRRNTRLAKKLEAA